MLGVILYFGYVGGAWALHTIHPPSREWRFTLLDHWSDTGFRWYVNRGLVYGCLGIVSYGWLVIGLSVLRRAGRQGRMVGSLWRGVIASAVFVGSLFGSFWTVTHFWRDYFFDKRLMPTLLMMIGLAMLAGCDSQLSYGEVRRRHLFEAMLLAWLVGLAILWRWWSRPNARPPA